MSNDNFVRTEPIDLSHRENCPEATRFVQWIDHTFPDILKDPTSQALEVAMLRVAQEYNLRRRGHTAHRYLHCRLDVFHERFDQLWEKQRSLCQTRVFEASAGEVVAARPVLPELYLGEEE